MNSVALLVILPSTSTCLFLSNSLHSLKNDTHCSLSFTIKISVTLFHLFFFTVRLLWLESLLVWSSYNRERERDRERESERWFLQFHNKFQVQSNPDITSEHVRKMFTLVFHFNNLSLSLSLSPFVFISSHFFLFDMFVYILHLDPAWSRFKL